MSNLFVYVGLVNRNQQDINTNKSIQESLKAEKRFFENHPVYRAMATRLGTPYLVNKLNAVRFVRGFFALFFAQIFFFFFSLSDPGATHQKVHPRNPKQNPAAIIETHAQLESYGTMATAPNRRRGRRCCRSFSNSANRFRTPLRANWQAYGQRQCLWRIHHFGHFPLCLFQRLATH